MGFFDRFTQGNKGPKKPKKFFEVNAGTYKILVHGTNDTQDLLSAETSHILKGTSGIAIALCERTPEQVEAGFPDEHCLNVCVRNAKFSNPDNTLGYIDVDHAHAGFLKEIVAEHQLVEAHASLTNNGSKYRMNVLIQPPENRKKQKQAEKWEAKKAGRKS